MFSRDHTRELVIGVAVAAGVTFALWNAQQKPPEVNTHDPAADRVTSFEIQTGEVAVVVRVCRGEDPVSGAVVWAPFGPDEGP